jgi:hypothetical protein
MYCIIIRFLYLFLYKSIHICSTFGTFTCHRKFIFAFGLNAFCPLDWLFGLAFHAISHYTSTGRLFGSSIFCGFGTSWHYIYTLYFIYTKYLSIFVIFSYIGIKKYIKSLVYTILYSITNAFLHYNPIFVLCCSNKGVSILFSKKNDPTYNSKQGYFSRNQK